MLIVKIFWYNGKTSKFSYTYVVQYTHLYSMTFMQRYMDSYTGWCETCIIYSLIMRSCVP